MKRAVTIEIDEEIYTLLKERADLEGRVFHDVLFDLIASVDFKLTRPFDDDDYKRRIEAFERHIGAWDSGEPNGSDNERIELDLLDDFSRGLQDKGR